MSRQEPIRDQADRPPLDSELSMRGILISATGLVLVTLVAIASMWGFTVFILDSLESTDPPPPVLEEAREPYLPPAPRLQAEPYTDLDELRAEESRLLYSYGWVNEAAGIGRVPVERAMELLISRGSVAPLRMLQPGTEESSASTSGDDQ